MFGKAGADTFLGEFCWNITLTENESGPKTPETILVRMRVTNVAGISYTLQGIASSPDCPAVVDGTGILSGSQVLMTLAMSQ